MKINIEENKLHIILFILILLVAIGTRMFAWPYGISQVNVDEAMTAINSKALADGGVDMYGTSFPVYLEAWGTGGQSVVLFYLMAFFFKIFGVSMVTVRLPMLLVSILSIIVFYDLIKHIFNNKKLALFAMAFVSICPWHLLQSIWSIDCNMFPHFMLFSVYFLYRGISDKKWMLYLSMVFFALTMYTYGVSLYIVPFFLLACAIYLIVKKKVTIKELIICIVIYLLVSFPIIIMYVINALKIDTDIHLGPITIQYFDAYSRTDDMIFFSQNIGETFIKNVTSLFKVFFMQYDGLEWNGTKIFGTVYHISLFFFIYGILNLMINKKERNIGTFFMTVWLILSFILGIIIREVNINRINILWFPTLFFSFYGIYSIYSDIKSHSKKENEKIFKYAIIAIYLVLFISFTTYLYSTYTSKIDMSGCFARKITDAAHYVTADLKKDVVYYCPVTSMYIRFQDIIDNVTSEHISNKQEFADRIKNKKDTEAFVITEYELENSSIDITNYEHKKFGITYVIY